ncbi:hypothetical protein LCGC14_1452490 [marine sediment metagenome]|uniref:Uncharacterized protein n=1 Tax=marine sediment metagenome TaxID=412755 RepID=A0A0F9MJ72_9ZZZZ
MQRPEELKLTVIDYQEAIADIYKRGKVDGRKEVVDFIGQPFEHNEQYLPGASEPTHFEDDCFACKYEAKLKEWGL